MASSSDLSLDCKPQSYSMLLKSFGDNSQSDLTTQKLEDLLSCLEQERVKIDAFKRELPLCMQLLNNAVEVYKQQLQAYKANSNNNNRSIVTRPILEEFIPLKNQPEKVNNWMTTAQLWSQTDTKPENTEPSNDQSPKDKLTTTSPKLKHFDSKQRQYGGGAFLPFSKEQSNLPELALSTEVKRVSTTTNEHSNYDHDGNDEIMINNDDHNNKNNTNLNGNNGVSNSTTSQSNRKARRCWSPDLHRRFVQALQMLGGSQATPKQIRELMKVDGLTNDEVKSHLQKYRLHTRRPSPSPQTSGGPGPHLVVLGGIWVPPEYATAHGGTPTLYHHHHHHSTVSAQPPPHFCSSQEFYTTPPPPQPIQPHNFQTFNGSSGGGGAASTDSTRHELTESVADERKSPESGGRERKGLASLRVEGESQSNINGSEICLKF